MRFFAQLSLAWLSLCSLGVQGTPIEPRQNGFYAVTGNPTVAPRLEIREMQKDFRLWNLFLTGLQRLQYTDQNNKLSYYQIAGIHGQPAADWDGVGSTGNRGAGWCSHNSNIFGTWHRPYLVLLEMMIQNKARELVEEMPNGADKDQWRAAANRLRLPYWDWALNPANGGPILPASVTAPAVSVTFPGGRQASIGNPLYQYGFRPLVAGAFSPPLNAWRYTVRGAANINNPNTPSNNVIVEANFKGGHNSVRSSLYNVLTQRQSFNQFSNAGSERSNIGNIESIHNGIHATFGASHMLYPIVSGFDPVFWLHHANMDRLTAMWQKLYPDTYVTPFAQADSTYFYNRGQTLDANSELRPFHRSTTGGFWTSNTVRNTATFGYTYPELSGTQADLRATINRLYAPQSAAVVKRADKTSRTYIAVIDAPWAAVGTSYVVRLFMGQPTTPVERWMQDKNYVGSMAVLARQGIDNDAVLTGTVILTDKINERRKSGNLLDLVLDSVLGFLKKDLVVKIEKDGKEIPRSEVPGLKVKVVSTEVQGRTSDTEFPRWLQNLKENLEIRA